MSNEKENPDTESTENNSSLIGVDPLAWLSEEEKATVLNQGNEVAVSENDSSVGKSDSS